MHQNRPWMGHRPRSHWRAYSAPQTSVSGFKSLYVQTPTSKKKGGEEREERCQNDLCSGCQKPSHRHWSPPFRVGLKQRCLTPTFHEEIDNDDGHFHSLTYNVGRLLYVLWIHSKLTIFCIKMHKFFSGVPPSNTVTKLCPCTLWGASPPDHHYKRRISM